MALDTQVAGFPFVSGEVSSKDRKLLPGGVLSRAENVRYDEEHRLVKRNGFAAETMTTTGAAAINDTVKRMFPRGSERCAIIGNKLYSQSETLDRWEDRGTAIQASHCHRTSVYFAAQKNVIAVDSAVASGIRCYTWMEIVGSATLQFYGNIAYLLTDETTGAEIARGYLHTSNVASQPRVLVVDTSFIITFIEVNGGTTWELHAAKASIASPNNGFATDVTLKTDLDTSIQVARYDSDAEGDKFYAAYYDNAGTTKVIRCQVAPSVAVTHTVTVAQSSSAGIGIAAEAERLWVVVGNSVPNLVKTEHSLADASVTHGPTTFGVSVQPRSISLGRNGASSITVFWSGLTGGTALHSVTAATATAAAGGSFTSGNNYPHLLPASRAIEAADGERYVAVATVVTEFQDSYYLCHIDGMTLRPVGVLSRGLAVIATNSLVRGGALPNLNTVSGGYSLALEEIYRTVTPNSSVLNFSGVSRWEFDFAQDKNVVANVGSSAFVAGGMLYQYDGRELTELGFCWAPKVLVTVPGAGTGTLTNGQTYQYFATYEWTDAEGNRHVSAPSIGVSGVPTNGNLDVEIRTLGLTLKSAVEIHLYRTDGNGTIPKRITHVSNMGIIPNVPTSATVTVNDDTQTPLDILYTIGGVQPNALPIGASHLSVAKGRLWAVDQRDVWYSKIDVKGEGVSFADGFSVALDRDATATAGMDGGVVIFHADGIGVVHGDGPNDQGAGAFSEPQVIPTDYGTSEPRSVFVCPFGVLFQGPRGIHLVPRGFGVPVWIGSAVREHFSSGSEVTGVHAVSEQHQVRFTLASGASNSILCLDYRLGEAGEWTVYALDDVTGYDTSVVWGNGEYSFSVDEDIYTETVGAYADPTGYIASIIETGDVRLAGLQGFKRVRKLLLLGEFVANCAVRASVAFDGEDSYSATSDYWYPSGSAGDQVEFQWNLRRQQCSSARFRFADALSGEYGATAGMAWNGFSLELGIQRGAQRITPSNRSA